MINNSKIQIPLEKKNWLIVADKDATILSSFKLAYACFSEAFTKVILKKYDANQKLNENDYKKYYKQRNIKGIIDSFKIANG
jgi:hypothetical protein